MNSIITENYIKGKINECENKKDYFKNEIEDMLKKHKILNHSFKIGEHYFLRKTISFYEKVIIVFFIVIVVFIRDIKQIDLNFRNILIFIISIIIVMFFGKAYKYEIVEYNKRKLKYNYDQFQIQLLNEEILKYQDLLHSNNNIDDLETKLKSEYHIKIKNNQNSKEIIKFIMKLNGINKKKAKLLYQQNKVSEDRFNYFQIEVIQQELNKIGFKSM